jgi:hypothetical protein
MFYATHTGILTSARSTSPYGLASQLDRTLPYRDRKALRTDTEKLGAELDQPPWAVTSSIFRPPVASVPGLSPGILSAQNHLTSELLRTL